MILRVMVVGVASAAAAAHGLFVAIFIQLIGFFRAWDTLFVAILEGF